MNPNLSCINFLGGNIDVFRRLFDEGEWLLQQNDRAIMLGNRGRKWMIENERILKSPHEDAFFKKNKDSRFPVIMNFYTDALHLDMKRCLAGNIGHISLHKIEFLFRDSSRLLFEGYSSMDNIDLFRMVTKTIIKTQMQVFLDLNISENELDFLADYEDLFTLGLYANDETQDSLYAQERFLKAENAFKSIFNMILKHSRGDISFATISEVNHTEMLSHFYNLSLAGSTNIAKLFCEIVNSISEMGSSRMDRFLSDFGGKITAQCLISESLRLLPWIDNQITGPFLNRKTKQQIKLSTDNYLKPTSEIFIFHCLDHIIEDLFPSPLSFTPERWIGDTVSRSKLFTFGLGIRKCCGESLVMAWLNALVEEYIKSRRFISENGIVYKKINNNCINEFSYNGKLF